MNSQYWKLTACALLAGLMTACSNNDDGGGSGGGGTNTTSNSLQTIVSTGATADPVDITDPAALKQDIANLFGGPDGEPVPVNTGDTAEDVVNRTMGN